MLDKYIKFQHPQVDFRCTTSRIIHASSRPSDSSVFTLVVFCILYATIMFFSAACLWSMASMCLTGILLYTNWRETAMGVDSLCLLLISHCPDSLLRQFHLGLVCDRFLSGFDWQLLYTTAICAIQIHTV